MENPINNTVFDSRDLIEYRDFLAVEALLTWNEFAAEHEAKTGEDLTASEINEVFENTDYQFPDEVEEWYHDFETCNFVENYKEIQRFYEDLEGGDFEYGESIISEYHFTNYCQELCEEWGYISKDFPRWIEIDWEATAENIKADYKEADFQGQTYYIRH